MNRFRNLLAAALLLAPAALPAQAPPDAEARIRSALPYATMAQQVPGLTLQAYEQAVRSLAAREQIRSRTTAESSPAWATPAPSGPPALIGADGRYLGRLSANPYDPESVSNPYGRYGSPYSPDSIHNPYGQYGSPYSPHSATNPYATDPPRIVQPQGGRLSANPYAPESTSNPYGRYGSPYSPDSINNPYGRLGNPYSPSSVTNPYAVAPPPSLPRPAAAPALPVWPATPALPDYLD